MDCFFNIIYWRFIHLVACVSNLVLFNANNYDFVQIYHSLFIHQFKGICVVFHLGLQMKDKVVMNICTHVDW